MLAQEAPLPLRLPYVLGLVLLVPAAVAVLATGETVKQKAGRVHLRMQTLRVPKEIRGMFIRTSIAGACGFAVAALFRAVSPSFLGKVLHHHSHLLAGVLVFVFLGFAGMGQLAVEKVPTRMALPAACATLVLGVGALAAAIVLKSLALLFASAVVSGPGEGLAVGFGLAQINEHISERRGEVNSSYFVLLYIGMAIPVIGVGLVASAIGLPTSGLIFCGIVGTVLGVLLTLMRGSARQAVVSANES